MIGSALNISPQYLQQLKQLDHNVLYSETVRFGTALADVKHNLKELQTKNEKLLDENETAASLLDKFQSTSAAERDEWEAFAQTMYDEVGKARAEKNGLQRDFEQQRLQLQAKQESLQDQVASLLEASTMSQREAEARLKLAQEEASKAGSDRHHALQRQTTLAAERDAAEAACTSARQFEQDAQSKQTFAERAQAAAELGTAAAIQERDAAQEQLKQALEEKQAAVEAREQAEASATEAATQASQADIAQHTMQNQLDTSRCELQDVRSELSNVTAQLCTHQQLLETATQGVVDLEKDLKALQKLKLKAEEDLQAEQAARAFVEQEAKQNEEGLQAQLDLLNKQILQAKNEMHDVEQQVAIVQKEAVDSVAEAKKQADDKFAALEREASDAAADADREAGAKLELATHEAALLKEAKYDAEELARQLKQEHQRDVAALKSQISEQKSTEDRLRNRLKKQDSSSKQKTEALVAAQQRNSELAGLLDEAQAKIGCAAKHRKSAQKQLDAQEEDFEKLGQRLKTASESPAVSVPTTSPRRVSRRDIDLGLSPAAPTSSPSPNSLPYQASPDHPDLMEENVMSDDGEEDDEISSGADAPQAQAARPSGGISSWMARSVGRLIPFSGSKAIKPESVKKQHSGAAQKAPVLSAALSPAAAAFIEGKNNLPASPSRRGRGRKGSSQAATNSAQAQEVPELMHADVAEQLPQAPVATTAGSKRKANELADDEQRQEVLKNFCVEYSEIVHRAAREEDGPPVKMRSPTHKRHRLALSSSPAADAAVAAAGDMAAEAVIQAAAAADTPAEAAAAAEQAAEVVKDAAVEAVGGHEAPSASSAEGSEAAKADDAKENETPAVDAKAKRARAQPASTVRQSAQTQQELPHAASPTKPAPAHTTLEAATAVALPSTSSTIAPTARRRGRPSKADLALRRQMEEEQSAAAVPATAAAPVTAVEAPGPSFTDAAKPAAAVGTKASKSSKAGANPTSSTTSAAKGKKSHAAANDVPSSRKDGEAEAEAPLPSQAQAEVQADSKQAPAASRKRPSASTATTSGTKKARTAKVNGSASTSLGRRTSGRNASKKSAGSSQAAGPARSTRSKSQTTASGSALLEDTASKRKQPKAMTPIAEGDEEVEEQ